MQEDRYNDFDLQIRSLMQDAEEEVPSRVWDAVSGRINRPKVVSLWWRRAAAGLAAAAAVALGVFFVSNRPSAEVPESSAVLAEIQPSEEKVAGATEACGTQTLLAESAIDRPEAVRKTSSAAGAGASVSSDAVYSETVPAAVFSDAPVSSAAPVSEEVVSDASEKQASESSSMAQDDGYRDDPFARMAYEDAHRKGWRESLSGFVQGNVTSNERSLKTSGRLASNSAGTPAQTSVKENSISTYGIPLSFGVGARYSFAERWSVSAALTYSLLSRSFTGTYYEVSNGHITREVSADINNNLHYIGIPVNIYYDVLESNKVSFYAFGGFSVEKGLMNKYRVHSQPVINYSESVPGVQWSSALGLGIEFMLNDYLNLYIDPSARYYFDCDQPTSVRTQKPFMMNLEVGLRFDI